MKELTIREAARMAGCDIPEGNETDGAKWIEEVIDTAAGLFKKYGMIGSYEYEDIHDIISELADGLVPIYTNHLWNVWVDLGGYNFEGEFRDFSSHTDHADRMNKIAQGDCYEWANDILYQSQVFWRGNYYGDKGYGGHGEFKGGSQ